VLLMRRCDRVLVLIRASIVTSQTMDGIIIIAVVPNRRYGLKRHSGMLESILDLNVGSVQ
jgi:hypothetical protein